MVRRRPGAPWLAVATVCLGAFMGQLDASIVSLAFPSLKQHFNTTLGAVQWVGLSYLLVLVAFAPAVGRFADMVGRKLLYTYGFVVFILGSTLCAAAPYLWALDLFRALQAVGAAMMQANSVAIIALAVPREKLGRAIGFQGAAQAAGLSLGPAVGGLLIGAGGWRLIFLVNVPVGLLGTAAAWFLIPRSRHLQKRVRFDWTGLVLFVPALSAMLLALSYGNELGWASAFVTVSLASAVVLGSGFVLRQRRARAPMIDPRLFARRAFSFGIASGLLSYLVIFGVLFVTPFYLETSRGFSPVATGELLAALPIALAVAAPFGGRISDARGPRLPTVAGMLIAAAGLVLLAAVNGSLIAVAASLLVIGAGLGFFTPANNAAIMAAAPREQVGSASGVLNLTRGLGTSLGLALTGLVFTVVAGPHTSAELVSTAYRVAALFLAAVAVSAAGFALLRSGPARHSSSRAA